MEWVNYHHLLYFRTVAREGSITRASKVLLLAQPTISGQIRALEETRTSPSSASSRKRTSSSPDGAVAGGAEARRAARHTALPHVPKRAAEICGAAQRASAPPATAP